ncbi:MAG: LysM peptidoglycan-binding domain-containing protein [Planctomycetes bacterium]|nr:LysM peptidoglycan-binding domain-containing protein [Planctomycetota bacterium]
MNHKSKIAIAAAITVALVAVLGYDLVLGKKRPAAEPTAAETEPNLKIQSEPEDMPDPFSFQPPRAPEMPPTVEPSPFLPSAPPSPAAPPPPPPAVPARSNDEYVVQSGDTLAEIAEKKYGDPTLWPLIQKANPNVNPRALKIGMKLVIPTRSRNEASVTAPAEPIIEGSVKTYVIQAGDTLESIAKRFYKSFSAAAKIQEANPETLHDPDVLEVGTRILLPDLSTPSLPVVTPGVPGSTKTAAEMDPRSPTGRSYTVQRGDSLWKISAKFNGGQGIMPYMTKLVNANSDKLRSTSTPLREGWVLAMPD